ncbi:MAG: membrane protein insertion efficiency factor YidD [Candidatus Binataceae bacterium]
MGRTRKIIERTTAAMALGLLALYRTLLSPLLVIMLGPACRFQPTCSQYAHDAIVKHGLVHGLALSLRRLLRCRPLGGFGYDPVPDYPHKSVSKISLKESVG